MRHEAFDAFKLKRDLGDKTLTWSLIFDEIAIRKQKLFSKLKLGSVNFGTGTQECNEVGFTE